VTTSFFTSFAEAFCRDIQYQTQLRDYMQLRDYIALQQWIRDFRVRKKRRGVTTQDPNGHLRPHIEKALDSAVGHGGTAAIPTSLPADRGRRGTRVFSRPPA
jgi:hypothetical protein